MGINKDWIVLGVILLFAAVLRFYKLPSVPPALDWDKVAIGWNAKTIFHTRRDEYGTKLPLTFKSFGDYKAPVYIYLTAPIVGLFGMNEISVRFLSAFTGVLSVGVLYFLVKEVLGCHSETKSKNSLSNTRMRARSFTYAQDDIVGLLSATLLAISPWHLLLSRPAFEQNLALFFILAATWLFFLGLKKPFCLPFSALSFVLSLYTYHSPKIFVPAFLFGLAFLFRKKLFNKRIFPWALASLILGLLILLPLVKLMLFSEGGARFEETSIFYTEEGAIKPVNLSLVSQLGRNYLIHYSPTFLFSGGDQNPRIQMREIGPLLLIKAPFLLLGLAVLVKKRKERWAKVLFWWFLVGPIAAVVGFEVPHPIRAFNLMPALAIIIGLGIFQFFNWLKKVGRNLKLGLTVVISVAFLVNIAYFLYCYFSLYPIYSAPDWQYGYKEVAELATEHEDKVEKIILTSHYGQPHIFMLFYQNRDPQQVFWGAMSKYLYRNIKWDEDPNLENVLLIGTPEEIPGDAEGNIQEIKFPDGEVAFRIVKTD